MVFTASALSVALLARASGGFQVGAWAPAGISLVLAVAALLALGVRPSRPVLVAAGGFVALGGWAVLSVRWGGIPDEAWRQLDQTLIVAAALVLGCVVAAAGRAEALRLGVLAGITLNSAEILLRCLFGHPVQDWFYGRTVDGTLGYHNAQANICAIGICLAVAELGRTSAIRRACAGAALGLLVGTLLLTQSRAGLAVAAVAVVVVAIRSRSSSMVLRIVPATIVAVFLLLPLRAVDRALVHEAPQEIRDAAARYAAWVLVAAVLVAGVALLTIPSRRLRLQLVGGIAVIIVAATSIGLAVELRSPDPFGGRLAALEDTDPNLAAAGSTRLLSLSLNGRRDAWRVAWHEGRQAPLVGQGQGTFTRAWTKERRLLELYVVQPHSVVLEVFSELGAIGLALFVLGIGAVVVGVLRSRDRLGSAAALGALTAVLGQAVVDWTWSFPGLLVPVFLVAGATSRGVRGRSPRTVAARGGSRRSLSRRRQPADSVAGATVGRRSRRVRADNPALALRRLETARRWNRWNPLALEIRGSVRERQGAFVAAADDYARAATLVRASWLDRFREARAAKAAGDLTRARRACKLGHAGNPAEHHLYEAIC